MVQTVARTRFGPETYEVSSNAVDAASVVGGLLVEPDAADAGKVKLAANESTSFLGVALYDAQPAGTTGSASTWGFATLDTSVPQKDVAVAWHGSFKLLFLDAADFGDLVYPAAAGQVKSTIGTATRAVGQVIDTAGVAAGARGLVRLF